VRSSKKSVTTILDKVEELNLDYEEEDKENDIDISRGSFRS
jgi:hypothetical protein